MLGSSTPVQRSRKRTTELWSATCASMWPPTVHGDTIVIGTRTDRPIGLPWNQSSPSPLAGRGGTGGGT
jgi:hypothetical protein